MTRFQDSRPDLWFNPSCPDCGAANSPYHPAVCPERQFRGFVRIILATALAFVLFAVVLVAVTI